jgi:hypothetical protein
MFSWRNPAKLTLRDRDTSGERVLDKERHDSGVEVAQGGLRHMSAELLVICDDEPG